MSRLFFWFTSTIWSFLSWLARALESFGILKSTKLSVRVVSVGNIQAGGAGKTPLVAAIAREAQERGLLTCILCRGYGGAWERNGGVISPQDDQSIDPRICGDEAALLHGLVPTAWIGVGADRVKQFEKIQLRTSGAIQLVILDDGFQHWKIKKDIEILALTSCTRITTLFRDWTSAISRSHLIVWTKGNERPNTRGRDCTKVRFQVKAAPNAGKFWLMTGIADPLEARRVAENAGYQIERHIQFPDHARYEEKSVQAIFDSASRASCSVLVTGKDWVKLRALGFSESTVRVIEPELVFVEGKKDWDQILWGSPQ